MSKKKLRKKIKKLKLHLNNLDSSFKAVLKDHQYERIAIERILSALERRRSRIQGTIQIKNEKN